MALHEYTKDHLVALLDGATNRTLGQVDVNKVFDRTIINPKITGIAGDVIEQSVLGYPSDSDSEPDLIVDGVKTELKTTGLQRNKGKSAYALQAKEPMSITGVSVNNIAKEYFEDSRLWHKLEHLLFVYYFYNSDKTVTAAEYADFVIQGYQFFEFSDEDREILKNDWLVVHDFVKEAQETLQDPETVYPQISKLRTKMLYMDTAPKWPHSPRFRLRRKVVSTIAQEYFGEKFEPLKGDKAFTTYNGLEKILSDFTRQHKNQSIEQIAASLDIPLKFNAKGIVNKSVTAHIMSKVFGADSSLSETETFAKTGIIPKTITLTTAGGRTEDTKFDAVDFTEWCDKDTVFEDSYIYEFFMSQKIMFIVFEEAFKDSPLEKNIFKGFKILTFSDDFIENEVHRTWNEVRDLVNNNKLQIIKNFKKDGTPKINPKTGLQSEAPNFPKSSDHSVFLRGTGMDSTQKTLVVNGLHMLPQNFWIKGKVLVDLLNQTEYIK